MSIELKLFQPSKESVGEGCPANLIFKITSLAMADRLKLKQGGTICCQKDMLYEMVIAEAPVFWWKGNGRMGVTDGYVHEGKDLLAYITIVPNWSHITIPSFSEGNVFMIE